MVHVENLLTLKKSKCSANLSTFNSLSIGNDKLYLIKDSLLRINNYNKDETIDNIYVKINTFMKVFLFYLFFRRFEI